MKILPGRAQLLRTDGQTDMTELIAAFRNFANASDAFTSWRFGEQHTKIPRLNRRTGLQIESSIVL